MVRKVLYRGSLEGDPQPAEVEPRCPSCRRNNFRGQAATMANIEGVLVYCGHCGTVVSWAAVPQTKRS